MTRRRKTLVPALARWLLGLGIAANPAANVTHGLGHGLAGGAVAAWPAMALVCSCELLMMIIRNPHTPANSVSGAALTAALSDPDPVQVRRAGVCRGSRGVPGSLSARDPRATPCGPSPYAAGRRRPAAARRENLLLARSLVQRPGDSPVGARLTTGAEPRTATSGRRVMQYRTLGRTGIKVKACPGAR